ncbi:MAG TPA: HTTM domain-containing protein, partial [Candidatus Binatia bacterium]|nr:HTTM domain-containing protein [Candidatus Binatia bacterium]
MGPGRVRERLVAVFEVDVRSLAVLRAGLGLLLLIDLVLRSRDLVAHYTDAGVLPRAVLFELGASRWLASVHFVNGTWAVQALLFAAAAIAAVALLVGYRTRLASVVCWGMLVSVNARNPLVVLGGDVLMRVALFWAMFLPLGARWSVDRALGRTTGPPARSVVSGGTVAYLVQMVLVYGISALRKSSPEWRSEGSALYYALSLDHLTTPLGEALLAFPGLLRVLTHGVFWLEVMAPVLLLAPVWKVGARCLVIGALALMHLGIAATLRVGLFPWIAVVTLVPFLPGPVWDALDAWARRVLGPWSGGRDREPEIATAPAGAAAPGPRSGVGRRPR